MDWIFRKLHDKLEYWKIPTWPLHVRLRIVQSILMAYVQFFLPLIHWSPRDISAFMSQAMELLWKTKSKVKALRLLKMDFVCSPKMHGGLNILNLRYHMLAHKATLLTSFFSQQQPWAIMLATMCTTMKSPVYGNWITDLWEVVLGKFQGRISGCPLSTSLLQDWKQVLSSLKWSPDNVHFSNSLRQESIHWSAVFITPLALQEPIRAYNLMKLGIRKVEDVIDDQ